MGAPGKIEVYAKEPLGIFALLYNFDIGQAFVKVEHQRWLEANMRPYMMSRTIQAQVVGFASRSGGAEANMILSLRRANAIEQAIWLVGPTLRIATVAARTAMGEEAAYLAGDPDGRENERWRAVFVMAFDPDKYPKPPPRPFVPWKSLQTSFDFLLPVHMSGAGAGGGEDSPLAGGLASAAEDQAAGNNGRGSIEHERFQNFPPEAVLSKITYTTKSETIGIPGMASGTATTVTVNFEYSTIAVTKVSNGASGFYTPDDVSDWINRPVYKYLKLRGVI